MEKKLDNLQVISFKINKEIYGVNILKVQEIIQSTKITELPSTSKVIRGVFNYRGSVIPLLNLNEIMGIKEDKEKELVLVLNFNNQLVAISVDTVEASKTYEWENILPVDNLIKNNNSSMFTGIVRDDDNDDLIMLIDFETILLNLSGFGDITKSLDAENLNLEVSASVKKEIRILVAEDSMMMSALIIDNLKNAGYNNLIICPDGSCAMERVEKDIDNIDLFILDIEMPYVNGFTLTETIKGKDKKKPVILFSSLINDKNRNKGEGVGADYQISKPDIPDLVKVVNSLFQT